MLRSEEIQEEINDIEREIRSLENEIEDLEYGLASLEKELEELEAELEGALEDEALTQEELENDPDYINPKYLEQEESLFDDFGDE